MVRVGKATLRADGRWQARVTAEGPAGVRRHTVYGPTRAAVLDKAREHAGVLEAAPAAAGDTLAAWSVRWLEQAKVRDNTRASYEDVLRVRILPTLGSRRLLQLTPREIQDWLDGLALSPRGKQYSHAVLRKCLNDAVRMELLHRNPALHTVVPAVQRADVQVLTRDQARTLLAAMHVHEPLCLLALGCGLRVSEVLAVRHGSVQQGVQGSVLQVRESVKHTRGVVTVGAPKTKRSRRDVPIPAHVLPRLPQGPAQEFMFGGAEPLSPWTVYSAWRRARAATGIDVTFHCLRHTYASWLLESGVPIIKVSRLLGHASISTTADIYGHVDTEAVDVSALAL